MASVWVYQDDKQVKKYGEDAASWYVGWIDPEGVRRCKSCGPGLEGERNAEKLRKKTEAELLTGTYRSNDKVTWTDFRAEYEEKIAEAMGVSTRIVTLNALSHFERLINPKRVSAVKTQAIDAYKLKRSKEPGKKKGSTATVATVNKELRHIRAVLRIAHEWKYLPEMPRVRMLKEPGRLPTFITPEHFADLYRACDTARMPENLPNVSPAEWWRALLVTGYMTGWRVSEILAMKREDVDLDTATAIMWFVDNKGKRDERVKLHPVVIEHLRTLAAFDTHFFTWNHNRRTLDVEFDRIQVAAGIKLNCKRKDKHEHTPACHVYGFHDLRRAFATQNAPRLTADALQKLMRHKSYQTTQRYINMASQIDEAVERLHVPDVLKKEAK